MYGYSLASKGGHIAELASENRFVPVAGSGVRSDGLERQPFRQVNTHDRAGGQGRPIIGGS